MDVALLCPLVTGIVKWNAPEPLLTVVIKGTFALVGAPTGPAAGALVREQEPLYVDWPWDSEPGCELERPGDFVPRKPQVDVFVVGHARSRTPTTALPLSLEVRGVPRPLRKRALAMSSTPSRIVPLAGAFLTDDEGTPVRLGPVPGPRDWRERVDSSFDFSRFNTAPFDQQLPSVSTGCHLVLSGLVADAEVCDVRLAAIEPAAFLVRSHAPNAVGEAVPLRCDTVFIDTDRALCSLTWRGEIAAPTASGAFLVVDARPDIAPSWQDVAIELDDASWTEAVDEEATLFALGVEVDGPPTDPRPKPRAKAETMTLEAIPPQRARALTIDRSMDVSGEPVLPFRPAEQSAAPAPFVDEEDGGTLGLDAPERVLPPHVVAALARAEGMPESTMGLKTPAKEAWPFSSARTGTLADEDDDDTRETIAPPAMGAGAFDGGEADALRAQLVATTAVPFLKPFGEVASVRDTQTLPTVGPDVAPPSDSRPGTRRRTETTTLSTEQVQDLQAHVAAAGVLPWQSGGAKAEPPPPEPSKLPETIPPPPGSIPFQVPDVPSAPRPGMHLAPPNPAAQAMGWGLGVGAPVAPPPLKPPAAFGMTLGQSATSTAPTSARSEMIRAASAPAPAVPRFAPMPLARYAAVKAGLLDDKATLAKLLASEKISERVWRLNERHMAIELARDASNGGSLAAELRRAIDKARRQKVEEPPGETIDRVLEHDIEQYCMIRAEIEEALDPAVALRELGLSHDTWAKIRRGWSGRCLSDTVLANQVRERLAEARNTLRRQADD